MATYFGSGKPDRLDFYIMQTLRVDPRSGDLIATQVSDGRNNWYAIGDVVLVAPRCFEKKRVLDDRWVSVWMVARSDFIDLVPENPDASMIYRKRYRGFSRVTGLGDESYHDLLALVQYDGIGTGQTLGQRQAELLPDRKAAVDPN